MDFLTFYDEIKQQILEAAEENLEGNIDFKMVPKNGQELHGISFFPGGDRVGITVYAEHMYMDYLQSNSIESLVNDYIFRMGEEEKRLDAIRGIDIMDANIEDIIPALVSRERNSLLLAQVGHVPFENLEVIFKWNVPGLPLSVNLPPLYFEQKNIKPQELLEQLVNSEAFKEQIQVLNVWDVVPFEVNVDEVEKETPIPEMLRISNKETFWGSGSILNKDAMAEAADLLGGNVYVLPSSIHECLLVKRDEKRFHEFSQLVQDMNRTPMIEEEGNFLSDEVYEFDRNTRELKIATDPQKKKGIPEMEQALPQWKPAYGR